MNHHPNVQKGHAAILCAMIVPALFGVFTLGADGARSLQQKARLMDASEVAALAVSAHSADNQSESGISVNRDIVTKMMNAYFPNSEVTQVSIERKECDELVDCQNDGIHFYQYQVGASIQYDAWFPGNDAIVGFGDKINVSGMATSRKYHGEAVDVVLVSDFSLSMNESWSGTKKYLGLLDIIKQVTIELNKLNALNISSRTNTIGMVPYNHYVRRKRTSSDPCGSWGFGNVEHLVFENNDVDYETSMNNILNTTYSEQHPCAVDSSPYDNANFYTIPLTSEMGTSFTSRIDNFKPAGYTASYLGIAEGFKVLQNGSNRKRIMLILSDGLDRCDVSPVLGNGPVDKYGSSTYQQGYNINCSPYGELYPSYEEIGQKLVIENGLCQKIKNKLEEGGHEVLMYVIGFDYEKNVTNKALDACVGADNILYAENKDQVLERVLSLVSEEEEIGHLK